ncbi:hypothetical protein [Colwellia sp. PAMC 21821]|uniref:hypothetical protein n=1 Tax=Colwellia sp. PAMC 21821 TaxID=1816219 RepID=UPI0009BF1DAA|nr:hypothetical protein [Colwellia sp. PAMC 21821]ARD43183.1 hypothetical protein A3Q33_01930 [Colwellia sp. PAMC 21821]
MHKYIIVLLAFLTLSCVTQQAIIESENFYQGTKKIHLFDNKGEKYFIGTVTFSNNAEKIHYKIDVEHQIFKDYFLSMKEMKCLEGPELWCHLAYPYSSPRNITTTDFSWLSHDLLFMYKKASQFGANFYQGIYYRFELKSDKLSGTAMAVDLNLLAAPPKNTTLPPVTAHDIDELEPTNRWLPVIEIQ